MSENRTSYRETRYGFDYGAIAVERVWSYKGAVCIRLRSKVTGKYVEVQASPGGRKMYVSNGQMPTDRENEAHG